MKNKKHFNIPIFIPHAACPFQCIFCNQKKISGKIKIPSIEDVKNTVTQHLSTISKESIKEIAFFGSNFTGIALEKQEAYLRTAYEFVQNGDVHGIRLSTRPDYINKDILSFLKRYGTTTIELGVQSMDDQVLKLSGRGHSGNDTIKSCMLIKEFNIKLGLQMMIGLPGDSFEKSLNTANKITDLGADNVRIYPALVIKDTELEKLYHAGKYDPLTLEEAVSWCADILLVFEEHNIDVIRMGLHPGEELLNGNALIAGPFHVSFRELVLTKIWSKLLVYFLKLKENKKLILYIHPSEFNYAIGYNSSNKKMLAQKFKQVIFKKDPCIKGRYYGAEYL